MNKKGYYININGIKTIIPHNRTVLALSGINIVELKLNDNLTYLYCNNNYDLKELILNDNLKDLVCDINTKLVNITNNCNIRIYE